MIVFTRSSPDLSELLDSHAGEHINQMVSNGWEPDTAADAWLDYTEVVAQAAADAAVAEGSWEASS